MLVDVADEIASGRPAHEAVFIGRDRLEGAGFRVDYIEARDAETFLPLEGERRGPARVLGAVFLGRVRLIDNVPIPALG